MLKDNAVPQVGSINVLFSRAQMVTKVLQGSQDDLDLSAHLDQL